jgi:hypothetical protein
MVGFNNVYPRSPTPLTPKTINSFPFYLDSRRDFFEKAWEEGDFKEGSVTMLMAPRMFGKTSFINMLPKFLNKKNDPRAVHICSCMNPTELETARRVVGEMLKGGKNRVLVLDELNYAIKEKQLWPKIVKLGISQTKGQGQTIVLTTSEMSSSIIKDAFDALHPYRLRLPALNEDQTREVIIGVSKAVGREDKISSDALDLIWRLSGGVPPYVRIALLHALNDSGDKTNHGSLLMSCMFDFFENLDAVESCIQTLTNCPIETAKMSDGAVALMADQFCLSCPIKCRQPSVKRPVVQTELAQEYGLVFGPNAIASPIAFYYNDYLGRKRFDELSSSITSKREEIQNYAEAYGKKEFINDILILLEIAISDPSPLREELNLQRLKEFFRNRSDLIFLKNHPDAATLHKWIRDFDSVCRSTVQGDKGIDMEVHGLRLSNGAPTINSYVQCKNWKASISLREVGIFHKFEMILRNAKQIHAAILISTSEIDNGMKKEAVRLTQESKSVFSCWSKSQLSVLVSAICGRRKETQNAIEKLSQMEVPTKTKGGALEFLVLKTFSVLAEEVIQW